MNELNAVSIFQFTTNVPFADDTFASITQQKQNDAVRTLSKR
ncbi:MAG: hypothetical protein U1D30_25785 [Planctomycetota bacterium]